MRRLGAHVRARDREPRSVTPAGGRLAGVLQDVAERSGHGRQIGVVVPMTPVAPAGERVAALRCRRIAPMVRWHTVPPRALTLVGARCQRPPANSMPTAGGSTAYL